LDAVEIVVPITIVETSGYVGPDRFEAIVASQLALVFGGNLISGQTAVERSFIHGGSRTGRFVGVERESGASEGVQVRHPPFYRTLGLRAETAFTLKQTISAEGHASEEVILSSLLSFADQISFWPVLRQQAVRDSRRFQCRGLVVVVVVVVVVVSRRLFERKFRRGTIERHSGQHGRWWCCWWSRRWFC